MSHFVYKIADEDGGGYVGTRQATGRMYESRTAPEDTLENARIFNTKAAATRSGRDAGFKGESIPVTVTLSR